MTHSQHTLTCLFYENTRSEVSSGIKSIDFLPMNSRLTVIERKAVVFTVSRLIFMVNIGKCALAKSPEAKETRTTISVARGTHENARLLLLREQRAAFRERQHDKRRLRKNLEDDPVRETRDKRLILDGVPSSLR